MSRSVHVPNDASQVAYIQTTFETEDDWMEFKEDVRSILQQKFPSFDFSDTFMWNEELRILENGHSHVIVSTYGGLTAISLVPKHENTLNKAWCGQVSGSFLRTLNQAFGENALRPIGRASNGEVFFERVSLLNNDLVPKSWDEGHGNPHS